MIYHQAPDPDSSSKSDKCVTAQFHVLLLWMFRIPQENVFELDSQGERTGPFPERRIRIQVVKMTMILDVLQVNFGLLWTCCSAGPELDIDSTEATFIDNMDDEDNLDVASLVILG